MTKTFTSKTQGLIDRLGVLGLLLLGLATAGATAISG